MDKRQKKIRFYFVLPVIVTPFAILIFWILGGGSGVANDQVVTADSSAFNQQLPDASFDEGAMDKLKYYALADKDSLSAEEELRKDPYLQSGSGNRVGSSGISDRYDAGPESEEREIMEKLRAVNQALENRQTQYHAQTRPHVYQPSASQANVDRESIDRLEQMMNAMQNPKTEDPEMTQLNGMLEKILDIQHPDRIDEKIRQKSEERRGEVFTVESHESSATVTHFGGIKNQTDEQRLGFHALELNVDENNQQNSIRVVVHETQTLVNGSSVKFRLVDDIYINGTRIPKGNFVYGVVNLREERLEIRIESIRFQNSLYPVQLTAFDLDGLEGLYVPGVISREVTAEAADRSLQSIGLTSINPSWGAQAAGVGIDAVKSLFNKKVKLVKVTVKAGYKALLFDEKQKSK